MASQRSSVLLGVFIVGQLIFLGTSNLIGFCKDYHAQMPSSVEDVVGAVAPGWPDGEGHLWYLMDQLAKTDAAWSQLTGQFQNWSLFAPTIARDCVFPAVEFSWEQDPASAPALACPLAILAARNLLETACLMEVTQPQKPKIPERETVLSENEPADLNRYFRWGDFRLRRYENNLVLTLKSRKGEEAEEHQKRRSEANHRHVADNAELLMGYLRWHLARAEKSWSARSMPRQVVLVVRSYRILDQDEVPPFWAGPPSDGWLARWQPGVMWNKEFQPLEWYDPVTRKFQNTRR